MSVIISAGYRLVLTFPTLTRPCKAVYRRTSLISSYFLLHFACFVRLIWMVLEMGGRWPYICCFAGSCFQNLFSIARCILVQFPSSIFSIRLVSVHVVHPYSRIYTTTTWRKLHFILSDKSENINIYVTNTSPYKTPATVLKKLVSPSSE